MSEIAERLKGELAQLPNEDRAALAQFLISTLDEDLDSDAEEAWDAELDCRLKEIESGNAVGIPAEQVFEELRRKYS